MDINANCSGLQDFNNYSKTQMSCTPDFQSKNITKKQNFCTNIKNIEKYPSQIFNKHSKNSSKLNFSTFKKALNSNLNITLNNGSIMERKIHSMKNIKIENKLKGTEYNENNEYNKELINQKIEENNSKIDKIEIIDNTSTPQLDDIQTKCKQENIAVISENIKVNQVCCSICKFNGEENCIIF